MIKGLQYNRNKNNDYYIIVIEDVYSVIIILNIMEIFIYVIIGVKK